MTIFKGGGGIFRKILGGTDDTIIGNVGDRLKVNVPGGAIPTERVIPGSSKLKNGGSADMTVNGATTSVTFSTGPTTTDEIWYLTRVGLAMDDSGNSSRSDFGAIASGLTNGLRMDFVIDGTTYTGSPIKTNSELIQRFESTFRGQSTAFINDANFVSAIAILQIPTILQESTSDEVRVVVQDNLTGLDHLEVTLFYDLVVG